MDIDPLGLSLAFGALLLACTMQSAFGFELALVAVPLLSLRMPLALVTPLLALLSMTLGAAIAWRSRAAVRTDLGWRLLASAAAGVPVGIALVAVLDGDAVQLALGAVVLVAGVRGLVAEWRMTRTEGAVPPSRPTPRAVSRAAWPFGFLAGVLGGAWNLMGPPLVMFMQWSGLDPKAFRATLHAFAFAINAVVVTGWLIGGAIGGGGTARSLVVWYVAALVPLSIGGRLGSRLAERADAARYRGAVHALLIAAGVALVVTAPS